jgi:hypothetical protein
MLPSASEDDLQPGLPRVDPRGQIEEPELSGEDFEEAGDGGLYVTMDDATDVEQFGGFYQNLAEVLPESATERISVTLIDLIERDKEARSKRDEQYEEGIRRTGLGDDAPGGANFQGATRVVHPMLTEACVDFAARAIKELWPRGQGVDGGPVKDQIIGDVTRSKIEKAKRKTHWMNYQVTQLMPEFRAELEQLLTQLPLAGAQYIKMTYDRRLNRPKAYFIPIDEVYLPYAATSFYSAERKTHVQWITELEYNRRVDSRMYIDVDLPAPEMPEPSRAKQATDKVEGAESDAYNDDGLRDIFEVYCYLEVAEDPLTNGSAAPYIVSIDQNTKRVLSIYRNWHPSDQLRAELDWIVEWPFVPWRGAYPIGLTHMIGGLSAAATGALRALLDSAHIANSQTLAKLKGGSRGGQNITIEPTQIVELEGPVQTDDIRKLLMPLPYNQPSPVLLQLLGFLVDAGKGVVQTTMSDLADQPANQPVGTTLALIEQGMTVFNAIHARLHDAMARTLKILHRINAMYLRESDVYAALGEVVVKRRDFEGPVDVVPVSDPNIFSEVQRFAQIQIVEQRAMANPALYDIRKVEELILEQTKIPNAKGLLLPKPEPQKLNPVNENVACALGRPIVAFPDQDHMAHLQVHAQFMMNPVLGGNPLIGPTLTPAMLQHFKEHILYLYVSRVVEMGDQAVGGSITQLMDKDEDVSKEFDRTMALLSGEVAGGMVDELAPVMQLIEQAMAYMQQIQQAAQPQQMDPAAVAMAEVDRKRAADAQKAQIEQAKLQQKQGDQQLKAEEIAARAEREADRIAAQRETNLVRVQGEVMRNKSEEARVQAQIDSKEAMNTEDNQTALVIASMRGSTNVENGTGIDPNPNP